MQNIFHAHHWITSGTHYALNRRNIQLEDLDINLPMVGTTRIYQQCEGCGSVQETVVSGHYVAQGVTETLDNC